MQHTTDTVRTVTALYTYTFTNHAVPCEDRKIGCEAPLHTHTDSYTVDTDALGKFRVCSHMHAHALHF